MALKKIYVFGNDYLSYDSYAKKVAKKLGKKFEVVECQSPELLLEEDNITILDVVKDADGPFLIKDISILKERKLSTAHDFDLGFFLKLMQGMGINKNIRIIGLPMEGNPDKTAKEVLKWI